MFTSTTKRSINHAAAAAIVLFALASPAAAEVPHNALTSHSPWLAPVGHRQPTRTDALQGAELLSDWERRQIVLDAELDRKLIICRGC